MGISESHQQFAFKIEPRPGGGYVSSSENPALVFEAATEEEVQQKALEKIGQLAGPEIAAAIRDLQKPGRGAVAGEKKFSVSINKKISFSIRNKHGQIDSGAQLASATSDPFAQSAPGGSSSIIKFLLVIAVLLIVFLLLYRR